MNYTAQDIQKAGFTLEPAVCDHCKSTETVYHQYIGALSCANCGEWSE